LAAAILLLAAAVVRTDPAAAPKAVLVIHGGAGAEPQEEMTAAMDKQYRADLEKALHAGYQALRKDGGTSLDAVEAAIRVLEDSPRFNAGRGAVFTREGRNELDASIMEGKGRQAGAVAGVCRLKNPISAARAVMEKSGHVLMIGDGAERFALSQGVEQVSPLYFWTEQSWKELQQAKEKAEKKEGQGADAGYDLARHMGTVGAVALDRAGNLAAGTSTGGLTYKRAGRVGDSPIVGAGTYADNDACGVSCTGIGEIFIRHAVAHDVAARMKYAKLPVAKAVDEAFRGLPERRGGVGGLIALDREGNVVLKYNTNGMYRGYVTSEGKVYTAIYEK
jgi:beta-aspartyl-peptidase (threonine type)